jgi:hypothetical protein
MRRGSFRLRLPRGRRSLKASPAFLGVAIFLVILVPTLFYLFPQAPDPRSLDSDLTHSQPILPSGSDDHADELVVQAKSDNAPEPVLKVASSGASILASLNSSTDISHVYLENAGTINLRQVRVQSDGKTLGLLSELVPGEKKVLAISGPLNGIQVSAFDPSEKQIAGQVQRNSTVVIEAASATAGAAVLNTMAASGASVSFSGSNEVSAPAPAASAKLAPPASTVPPIAKETQVSPLTISIAANRSEGLDGEIVGYRCKAVNLGATELSDVRITCAGKMSSTRFLPPHKELYLDGVLVIEKSLDLSARVDGKDANGIVYTNETSTAIKMISPFIKLEVTAPGLVRRGDVVNFQIRVENSGDGDLTDLSVSDSFGEIGRIEAINPGAFQVLQTKRVVTESLQNVVKVIARDDSGQEHFVSQSLNLRVRNSSLEIRGDPAEVRTYPGNPAGVTWILSNTGEELLKNITLDGDGKRCMLAELPPGGSVRMAAIYSKNTTTWINVTARGVDENGFDATAGASVLLKSIQPGISLRIMPTEIETCPGDTAEITGLVTNSGDDRLSDVVVTQNGSRLATIGRLEPGEFKVVNSRTVISDNCTIQFAVTGKDSSGRIWSDGSSLKARTVVTALKVFVSASPPAVMPGARSNLTCTVANTGSVPLYSIFVISKNLGPLGNIDYLSPKRQMVIHAEKAVTNAGEDTITAEGFTQDKKPVQGSFSLSIGLLSGTARDLEDSASGSVSSVRMAPANISYGDMSLPFNLPDEMETASQISETIGRDLDSSATRSNNAVIDGITNLLRYVETLLGMSREEDENNNENKNENKNEPESHAAQESVPQTKDNLPEGKNYELSIVGVKSSEHGAITILDVNAMPSRPASGEPVKVTVHIQSPNPITSASVKYGLSESPLTKQDMLGVARVYDSSLNLESGSTKDGYWSCTIPGKAAGTYMPLSVWMTDGSDTAEGGPYLIHWSTVKSAAQTTNDVIAPVSGSGRLFIESSSVKGIGEVSIKDTFHGAAMHYNEKMMGNGSISLETQRSVDRKGSVDNFIEKKDLVFTGGNLKGHQTIESPTFDGGMGASVTERFNLSHVDRSETTSVSSASYANNTLNFKTEQAFNGTWNIQTKYAKFFKKIKADQQYTGSFQTQKDIKFEDAGQN